MKTAYPSKLPPLWFIKFVLESMEPLKDAPDREAFCVGFDEAYERRKQLYKELTGKEWEGGHQC